MNSHDALHTETPKDLTMSCERECIIVRRSTFFHMRSMVFEDTQWNSIASTVAFILSELKFCLCVNGKSFFFAIFEHAFVFCK